MDRVTFSVVVPCYNLSNNVEKTIKNILDQTYKSFEIILIDDGSTDDTLQILNNYQQKDERIVVLSKVNGGVASARNEGIKKAKNDYIYFLDGDDLIENNLLECAEKIIRQNDELDMFYFGFNWVDEEEKQVEDRCFPKYDKLMFSGIDFLNLFFTKKIRRKTGAYIIKKSLIDQNKLTYSMGVAYGEDEEFFIRTLLHTKKVYYDKNCYFHYLQRSDSAMNGELGENFYKSIEVLGGLREEILKVKNKELEESYNLYLKYFFFYIFVNAVKSKSKKWIDFIDTKKELLRKKSKKDIKIMILTQCYQGLRIIGKLVAK